MHDSDDKRWLDDPKNVNKVIYALVAACVLSVIAEFFVHMHPEHPWESMFSFYSVYGFISIVVLVLGAKLLRKIVMRGEDYYDG